MCISYIIYTRFTYLLVASTEDKHFELIPELALYKI